MTADTHTHPDDPKVAHIHQLFAWPVLIASLATVIGLFVSLAADPLGNIGEEVVMLASLVIVAESLLVALVSKDKRRWLKRHGVLVVVSLVAVFLFVVGVAVPLHLLRLVRGFSASPLSHVLQHAKVLRVGELSHAKQHLSDSSKLAEKLHQPIEAAVGLAVPVYLFLSLRDPNSESRELLRLTENLFVGAHWRAGAALIAVGLMVVVVKRRVAHKPAV